MNDLGTLGFLLLVLILLMAFLGYDKAKAYVDKRLAVLERRFYSRPPGDNPLRRIDPVTRLSGPPAEEEASTLDDFLKIDPYDDDSWKL